MIYLIISEREKLYNDILVAIVILFFFFVCLIIWLGVIYMLPHIIVDKELTYQPTNIPEEYLPKP